MMRFVLAYFLFYSFSTFAQDLPYVKQLVSQLSSPGFHGRGYVQKGDSLASELIKNEFRKNGLEPLGKNYFQDFTMRVNTFPGRMLVKINNKVLAPGKDYLVSTTCPTVKDSGKIFLFDSNILHSKKNLKKLDKTNLSNSIVIFDEKGMSEEKNKSSKKINDLKGLSIAGAFKNKATVLVADKLTWSVGDRADFPLIILKRDALQNNGTVVLDIENKFIESYHTRNVMAMVKGTQYPDSFIVFTAHYDHLGCMGAETYFPGANDNASGTAMLLDLAKYYALNPQPYSIAFIAFAAEEAGLIGSEYYVLNPVFPLKNIRFLFNLDLLGNGEDGATIVNGSIHKTEFAALDSINSANNYLTKLAVRGKAANSDHYFFEEAGVKTFFMYTHGAYKAYHDVDDVAATLTFPVYNNTFKLLTDFTTWLIR